MKVPVEKTKINQKTLGPGESEVWSGRDGWACPNQTKLKKPRVDAGM